MAADQIGNTVNPDAEKNHVKATHADANPSSETTNTEINNPSENTGETIKTLEKDIRHEQWIMIGLTAAIVICGFLQYLVLRGQLNVMSGQLEQMQRQLPELQKSAKAAADGVELTRKQLIATQAAILSLRFDVVYQFEGPHGLRSNVSYTSGYAMATHVHESFDVFWKTLPGLREIGAPQHFEVDIPQLRREGSDGLKGIPFPGLTQETWEPIRQGIGNRTIEIKGTFRYENGFDSIPEQQFCWVWYAHPQVSTSSYQDFVDCSQYDSKVKFFAWLEKREAQTKK